MKKKSNILSFAFALMLFCQNSFCQTVILDVLTVNGQSASATAPINFGINTTITIGLFTQVSLPNAPSDSYPGTIKIIYQRNTSSAHNIATAGDGGSLLFFSNNVAGRNFSITLQSPQFDNTGGILYAEYETYSGIKYKSTNKSIIKSTITDPPIGPTNPSNNSNVTEYVPYEGIPLLPQLSPNSTSSDGTINEYNWVYDDEVFDKVFTINGGTGRDSGMLHSSVKLIPRIKITRPNGVIDYYVYTRGAYPNGSTFYAFVVNTSLQIQNVLSEDQYVTLGENSQTITGNVPSIYYGTGSITGYVWQKRQANRNPDFQEHLTNSPYKWQDIPNSNVLNYTPPYATQVMEYRRLTINNTVNSRSSSNVVGIYSVIPPTSKDICCNQIVTYQGVINTITGYQAITDNNYRYKWQIGIDVSGIRYWNDIPNANSNDYTPINSNYTDGHRTFHDIYYYRRIVIRNSDELYYLSNVVTRQFLERNSRLSGQVTNDSLDESVVVFPNPGNSDIHIKSNNDLSSYKLKIIDLTGKTLISKEPIYEDVNSLSVDISNLPIGTYNLVLENSGNSITKKFIKN